MTPISKRHLEEAKALLEAGRPLPDEFRNLLFENKREYELTYAAKERAADILADTMAVPLQPTKTFGDASDGWRNMLIFGDNLQVLKTLLELKREGAITDTDGVPGVTLVYIDPPFASQQEFRGARDEKAYQDKVAGAEFLEFLRKRLVLLRELLTPSGSVYVHLDTRKIHYMKVLMDEIFGESNFRSEVIWKRTSAHMSANRYGPVHDTLLVYSRTENFVWNPIYQPYDEFYVEQFYTHIDADGRRWFRSDLTAPGVRRGATGQPWRGIDVTAKGRHWAEPPSVLDKLDAQGRIHWPAKQGGMPRMKVYADESPGVPLQDVWTDIKPIHNMSDERVGYPTQKPLTLAERIIDASSRPGDTVLDAFSGSGTTLIAAEQKSRRWIGIDCGKLAVYVTQKRLLKLGGDKRTLVTTAPFTVFNAGLYDYDLLRNLAWEEFRAFALELFQCRAESHTVGKVALDGYLGVDHVLVFNCPAHKGATLDEAYVDDLHGAIGDRVGRRFFIIAPAASVRFLQDYMEKETKEYAVRYYVLRIPYSIIDEIHERGFTRLQQPISESDVNDVVDAVGFDFIQPPAVECHYARTKDGAKATIRKFETQALIRSTDGPTGFDALAMVMIDWDYDGKVFDLDDVVYADELAKNKYSFTIPAKQLGDHAMFIYVDVYGNEHREARPRHSVLRERKR